MLFASSIFAVFLAVVVAAHLSWPRRQWNGEKWFLLAASYFFYGWWDARFLALIIVSTAIDYWACRRILSNPRGPRAWLFVSIASNLGILGFFKYCNFFAESAAAALATLGIKAGWPLLEVVLPVGISFYTFQTMSMTIDTYRGVIVRLPSFLDVALYVAFFPQLVAGPIVRAQSFLPQIRRRPRFRPALFAWGWWLICVGLFKKTVIADSLARVVEQHMVRPDLYHAHALESWKAAVAFSLQIYCDFSGYSDVAIGIAGLLGIRFLRNFNAPYLAVSFSDFWRRWHISLSTWLRDYLYIPLGGSRSGLGSTRRNLMVTMLLGGLWHGASWNFVLWGGLHGAFLVVEQAIVGRRLHRRPQSPWVDLSRVVLVFAAVTLLWVPFRAPDLQTTAAMLHSLALGWSAPPWTVLRGQLPEMIMALMMMAAPWFYERRLVRRRPGRWWRVAAMVLMWYSIVNFRGGSYPFIYFQF